MKHAYWELRGEPVNHGERRLQRRIRIITRPLLFLLLLLLILPVLLSIISSVTYVESNTMAQEENETDPESEDEDNNDTVCFLGIISMILVGFSLYYEVRMDKESSRITSPDSFISSMGKDESDLKHWDLEFKSRVGWFSGFIGFFLVSMWLWVLLSVIWNIATQSEESLDLGGFICMFFMIGFPGVLFLYQRRGITIDSEKGRIIEWWGLIVPMKRSTGYLEDFHSVLVTKGIKIFSFSSMDYRIELIGRRNLPIPIWYKKSEESRRNAMKIATFLNLSYLDVPIEQMPLVQQFPFSPTYTPPTPPPLPYSPLPTTPAPPVSKFPLQFICPGCERTLFMPEPGITYCPGCELKLSANKEGKVFAYKKKEGIDLSSDDQV